MIIKWLKSLFRKKPHLIYGFTKRRVERIRARIDPQIEDDDIETFLERAAALNLNPEMGQIHLYRAGRGKKRKTVMVTGIHGFRKIAADTSESGGKDAAKHVFLDPKDFIPATSYVTVYRRKDTSRDPFTGEAHWNEYVPKKSDDNEAFDRWMSSPKFYLAKAAESQAWRAAFPAEMSDLYGTEEMARFLSSLSKAKESTKGIPTTLRQFFKQRNVGVISQRDIWRKYQDEVTIVKLYSKLDGDVEKILTHQ